METSTHRMACGAAALFALLLALAALALPSAAHAAYAPWAPQTSGTTQPLYGVWFADENGGWAVGGGGTILRTTNGGATWKAQASKTTQSLNAVVFTDAAAGWAVGNGGTILRTTNGGATWTAQKSGTTQSLHAAAFANATTGWAVGGRGTVLRTTDGGTTWTAQPSGARDAFYGVACADASTVWAVGNKGAVRRTTNGGATWTSLSAGTKTTLNAVGCSSPTTAWIAGNGGLIRKTVNGTTWVSQTSGTSQTLRAVSVIDASRVRIPGSSGTVRVTVNGGTSWAAEATGTTQTLYGAAWRGSRGWLVGAGGTILAYRPDTSAPTTTATGLQADDHSGWANAAVSVTLSATDAGTAGVAATYYTVDGGAQSTYAGPFSVSGQGHHTVAYWSVDTAANAEVAKSGFVNIDTTPPTIASDADAAWHATDVTVHLSATDGGGSDVAATQYRAAGASGWTTAAGDAFVVAATAGQGPHAYDIRSLDAAGNASVTGACTVRIDATPAVTTATNLGADQLSDWSTTARSVSLSADDGAGSGVESIHYTVDDGADQTYAAAFSVAGAGQHRVTYWSVDKNGNVESARTGWVNISDPYAQAVGLAGDLDSHWHNGTTTVTITAHGIPGPMSVGYQLDGARAPGGPQPGDDRGLRGGPPHRRLLREERERRQEPVRDRLRQHRHARPGHGDPGERSPGLGQPRRDPRVPRKRRLLGDRRDVQHHRWRRRGPGDVARSGGPGRSHGRRRAHGGLLVDRRGRQHGSPVLGRHPHRHAQAHDPGAVLGRGDPRQDGQAALRGRRSGAVRGDRRGQDRREERQGPHREDPEGREGQGRRHLGGQVPLQAGQGQVPLLRLRHRRRRGTRRAR